MGIRKIVHIDEEKCNGCGKCIIDCHEGALQIVNGKAKILDDLYCDGLGDCLKGCPVDAITIIEREAVEFSEEAVKKHLENRKSSQRVELKVCDGGAKPKPKFTQFGDGGAALTQWPVQLKLLRPDAPYFENADLLVTADCVAYAYKSYHEDFLQGRKVCVGCPKLDDVEGYIEKLTEIIKINNLKSITVLRMEVPCCSGIVRAVANARSNSGIDIDIDVVTISVSGSQLSREVM